VRRVSRCFAFGFGFAFAFAFALCGSGACRVSSTGAVAQSAGPSADKFQPRLRNKVRAGVRTQFGPQSADPRRGQRGGDPQQCAHRLWTGGGA